MFFWNSFTFSMIQRMLAVWSLVPVPFLIQLKHLEIHRLYTVEAWLWEFWALLCYCVRWVQLCCSLNILDIAFPWDCNENWCFPVLWPLLSFPNLLSYWVQHFHSTSFRIWNISTGIPSLPLPLFKAMLSKAHLTLHSRMSGSRWVITPSWLSGS